jgi:hypothetical protein
VPLLSQPQLRGCQNLSIGSEIDDVLLERLIVLFIYLNSMKDVSKESITITSTFFKNNKSSQQNPHSSPSKKETAKIIP